MATTEFKTKFTLDINEFEQNLTAAARSAKIGKAKVQEILANVILNVDSKGYEASLNEAVNASGLSKKKIEELLNNLKIGIDDKSVKGIGQQAGKAGEQAGEQFVGAFDKEVSNLSSIFTRAFNFNQITQAISTTTAAFSQFTTPYKDFDKQLRNIGTLGVQNFEEFRDAAINLSSEVPDTAGAITEAIYNAISAGAIQVDDGFADVEGGLSFIEQSAKLAIAGLTDTNSAVKSLAANLNAYGESTDEAGRYSDILFNTVNKGVTTIPELNASLSNVVPTAASMKIPFEQVTAAIAAMTLQGVPTVQATTKIRAALVELQKPGAELSKIMEAAGVSLESLQQEGLQVTLEKLGVAMQNAGLSATQVFSSVEAGGAALALSGENAQKYADILSTYMTDAVGSTDRAFDIAGQGIDVKVQKILNGIQGFAFSVFDTVGDGAIVAIDALNQIAPMASVFANLGALLPVDKFKSLGVELLTKLVPGFATAGAAGAASGTVTTLAWSKILIPLGLITAAFAGLYYFFTQTEKGAEIFERLKIIAQQFVDGLLRGFVILYEAVTPLIDALGGLFNTIFVAFSDIVSVIFEAISDIFDFGDAENSVTSFSDTVAGAFSALGAVLTPLIAIINVLIEVIKFVVNLLVTVLSPAIYLVIAAGSVLFKVLIEIGNFIANVFLAVFDFLKTAFLQIVGVTVTVIDALKSLVNDGLELVKRGIEIVIQAWNDFVNFIKQVVFAIWDGIKRAINAVVNVLLNIGKVIFNLIKPFVDFISKALNPLKVAFQSVVGFIGSVIEKIIELKNAVLGFFGLMEKKGADALGLNAKTATKDVKELNKELKKTNEEATKPKEPPKKTETTAQTEAKNRDDEKKSIEEFNRYKEQKERQSLEFAENVSKEKLALAVKSLEAEREEIKVNEKLSANQRIDLIRQTEAQIIAAKAEIQKQELENKLQKAIEAENKEFAEKKFSGKRLEQAELLKNQRLIELNENYKTELNKINASVTDEQIKLNKKAEKEIEANTQKELKSNLESRLKLIKVGNQEQLNESIDLQRQLLALEFGDVLQVDAPRTAEQEARYVEYISKIESLEANAIRRRLQLANSEQEAKRQIEAFDLQKKYEQDLLLYSDNATKRLEVERNFQRERAKLIEQQLVKDNVIFAASMKIKDRFAKLFSAGNDKRSKDEANKQQAAYKKEVDELNKAIASKAISYDDFAAKRQELMQKDIEAAKVGGNQIAEALAESFRLIADTASAQLSEAFSSLEKPILEIKTKADGSFESIKFSMENLAVGLKANAGAIGSYFSATFGAMITEGVPALEAGGKALLKTTLATIELLITSYIPAILAQFMVWFGPISGAIAGAGAIATVLGLLQVAKGAIGAETGQLEGVQKPMNRRGATDTQLTWVNPKEAILPIGMTAENKDLLKFWFAGGTTEDYFLNKFMPNYNNKLFYGGDSESKTKQTAQEVKINHKSAVEIELTPLQLSGNDLIAFQKRATARAVRKF